jgi:hypothetical protein
LCGAVVVIRIGAAAQLEHRSDGSDGVLEAFLLEVLRATALQDVFEHDQQWCAFYNIDNLHASIALLAAEPRTNMPALITKHSAHASNVMT